MKDTKVVKFRSRGIFEADRYFNKIARDLGYESFEQLQKAVNAEKKRRQAKRASKKARAKQ